MMEEKITFIPFHWGQFLAGIAFVASGISSFLFYGDGLLFFLFPLPAYAWTALLPLAVGTLFTARAIVLVQRVEITRDCDARLTIRSRGMLQSKVDYKEDDVDAIGFSFKGSKFLRWAIVFFMLVLADEVYLENGLDLLGTAPVAACLLSCFVLVLAGLACYIAIPRKFIEIDTKQETLNVPLPLSLGRREQTLLEVLGVNPGKHRWHGAGGHAFAWGSALFLLVLGVVLVPDRAPFLGEFTAPVVLAVAAKMIQETLRGDKMLVATGDGPQGGKWTYFLGSGLAFTFLAVRTRSMRCQDPVVFPHLRKMHFLEAACLGYIAWQSIKYGFRFAWWGAIAGPDAGLIVLAIAISCVVFVQWTRPVNVVTAGFGGYDRQICVLGDRDTSRARAMEFTRWLATARRNSRLLQALLVFAGLIVAATVFYLLSGPFPVV